MANDLQGTVLNDPKRGSIHHFSLMNSLLAVLNTAGHDETDAVLARYFLSHFDHLDRLNVYDVAEECFTSRSGIRRFCQSIGLENFSDLKSYAWEWSDHSRLFVRYAAHDDFRVYLRSSIERMMADIDTMVGEREVSGLATFVHDADQVVLLTSDFSSAAAHQFQQSMLYVHKIVNIITDSSGDVDQISALGPTDALIVVSIHGNYARAVQSFLSASSVPRALVTVDAGEELARTFDHALRLSPAPTEEDRTVFTQYGITYVLDLVFSRYLELYGR